MTLHCPTRDALLGKLIESASARADGVVESIQQACRNIYRFRIMYALASAAMHGRDYRGIDLTFRAAEVGARACRLGLIVLERLCEFDEKMNHIFTAAIVSTQLDHAERFGGTKMATTDVMAQQAFGLIDEPLLLGIDYVGEGNADDPFRLAAHLQFHQASYALLKQLGVDVSSCPRELSVNNKGEFCDRWQAPDREYWFFVDLKKTAEALS